MLYLKTTYLTILAYFMCALYRRPVILWMHLDTNICQKSRHENTVRHVRIIIRYVCVYKPILDTVDLP
jgi:hypothetical protein